MREKTKEQRIRVEGMPMQPIALGTIGTERISIDPFGSYTGRPKDPQDRPIQDADDL